MRKVYFYIFLISLAVIGAIIYISLDHEVGSWVMGIVAGLALAATWPVMRELSELDDNR